MRGLRMLLLSALVAAPLGAAALEAPHDASNPLGAGTDCQSCHIGHSSPGGSLNSVAGNFNLCQSCHAGGSVGFSGWTTGIQAVPGEAGSSHSWSGLVTNHGATPPPALSPMGMRTPDGKLQCSTCHDVHKASLHKGRQHVSVATGSPLAKTVGNAAATLTLAQPAPDADPAGYCVRVGPVATQFQISRDKCATWYGWDGAAWSAASLAGKPFTAGAPVALDVAGKVTATFSGTFAVGDRWQPFYISYPFLRESAAASAMCLVCHPDRNMDHTRVRGDDASYPADGANVFSHPVGVVLNANARGYDRATPLDATGAVQSAASDAADPARSTNNLEVTAAGEVHCLSCHRPHNADSNSLTLDPH